MLIVNERVVKCRACLLVLLATVLSGCIDSEHPLAEPAKADFEARLLGAWRQPIPPDDILPASEQVHLVFVGRSKTRDDGCLDLISAAYMSGNAHVIQFRCIPTKVRGQTYVSLGYDRSDRSPNAAARKYWIVRYALDGDRLTFWPMDSKVVQKAIEARAVTGVQPNWFFGFPSLTDSPENLRRFVSEWDAKGLFSDKGLKFHRVR
jgi:hypothetical protein